MAFTSLERSLNTVSNRYMLAVLAGIVQDGEPMVRVPIAHGYLISLGTGQIAGKR